MAVSIAAMTRKAKFKAAEVVKITANFPKDLWLALRHRALEDEETVTDILVRLSKSYVTKRRKQRAAAIRN
jgi:hypothetical protein